MDKLIYQKTADKRFNRIILPKSFVDKNGYEFYMEVYEDKIVLIPAKNKNKKEK